MIRVRRTAEEANCCVDDIVLTLVRLALLLAATHAPAHPLLEKQAEGARRNE